MNLINKIDNNCNTLINSFSSTIDERLFILIKEELNTDEQQQFVNSFKIYLEYGDDDTKFIINFDDIWKWVGFSQKVSAKRLLVNKFTKNIHYVDHSTQRQNGLVGSEKEIIMLNVSTFKKFCMKASTKRADDICDYYIKMEKIMFRYTKEKLIETQNKLNKFIEYDEDLFWNENQINDFNNKNVIYVAFIGIIDNERIYKFGKSEQIYTREFKQHQKFFDIFKMRFVIECDNMSFVEKEFKKFIKSIYLLKNMVINESNLTELFTIKEKQNIDYIIHNLIKLVDENPLPAVKNLQDKIKQKDEEIKEKNNEIEKYINTVKNLKEELQNTQNSVPKSIKKNIKNKEKLDNIKCETTNFEPAKDKIDYANELMKQYKDKIKVDVDFDTKYLITFNEYEDIQYKENLTEEEKQKKWTFDCAINMWKMFSISNVDKEFFDNYIGHYSKCEKYIEIYFKYLRFNDLNNSIEETIGKFKNKIEEIKKNPDYNIELYRYRVNKYYEKLIEAQKLLTFINSDKLKEQSRETFNTNINKYFNSISNDKFLEIKKLFDILRNNKINLIKNLESKHKLIIAKNILKDCFEINIEPKNKHKTCNLYYDFEKWNILSNKYGIIELE